MAGRPIVMIILLILNGWITMDHDTGNCLLSVCSNAAIGFYESGQVHGSGFWYPQWVTQTLFFGSMAAGNSGGYVVDSYYRQNQPDDRDWKELGDSLNHHIPPEFGLQEYDCEYDDRGHPTPKNLYCFQYSVMDASPDYDDFVIIEFIYKNNGSSALNGMYSAIFIDFDVPPNYTENYGKSDPLLRTVYLQPSQSNENPTVGIVYLGSKPQPSLPVANLSMVRYYFPGPPMDSQKFLYMNGTYQIPESPYPYDWSVVASAGPFDLPPGEEYHVAFAIVGGTSSSQYLNHCQNAIWFYDSLWAGIEEEETGVKDSYWFKNLIRDRLIINYRSDHRASFHIILYDCSGRRISNLYSGPLKGKGRLSWDMSRLPSGIYFLQIQGPDHSELHKIIRIE